MTRLEIAKMVGNATCSSGNMLAHGSYSIKFIHIFLSSVFRGIYKNLKPQNEWSTGIIHVR